jgi:hypothetical protein
MLRAQDSLTHLPLVWDSSLFPSFFSSCPCLISRLGGPWSSPWARNVPPPHPKVTPIPPHLSVRTAARPRGQHRVPSSCWRLFCHWLSPCSGLWICGNWDEGHYWGLPVAPTGSNLKQWASYWSPAAGVRPDTLFPSRTSGARGEGEVIVSTLGRPVHLGCSWGLVEAAEGRHPSGASWPGPAPRPPGLSSAVLAGSLALGWISACKPHPRNPTTQPQRLQSQTAISAAQGPGTFHPGVGLFRIFR